MADSKEIEPFWTADDVAAHVKMHPQTVYRMAREGRIPSYKIGSALRFRPSEVREWAESQATAAGPSSEAV